MNSTLDNIIIYNGYPLSVIVAVGFHCTLLALLLYMQSNRAPEALELVQPSVIKALFIDENPQVVNEENVQRQRLERTEQQRIAREQEQRRVQQEQQEQQAAAQREAEAQRALEQEQEQARNALVERQQLEQRQQAEKLKQEQEQRVADEQQRQRELAEAERVRQEQQELDRQRQEEASQVAQAEAARTEYELVQSATALIHEEVRKQWSRPPSARNGMRVVIQIRMLPTGELIETTVIQSSGDAAFDRAAEIAIAKAAPSFRQLAVLPINIFNANFRSLSLIFQPEDLLN